MKKSLLSAFLLLFIAVQILSQGSAKPRKCIIVFGAHADDVESMAGGTFAKYISEGYEGIYVGVINNTAGNAMESVGGGTTPPEGQGLLFSVSKSPMTYPVEAIETMQIRQEEARNAAAVFKATPVFLNFRESWIFQGRKRCYIGTDEFYQYQPPGLQVVSVATDRGEDVDVVVDLLKKYSPEIVIMHTTGGEKLDHGNSGYMMYLAFKEAMQKGVPVGKLWMRGRGWLSDDPAKASRRGKADVRIYVKDFIPVKYEALNKHISQNGGLRKQTRPEEATEEFITVLDNTGKMNNKK
jgi:LmbE family N-acetylglucosaminyl deacetylase